MMWAAYDCGRGWVVDTCAGGTWDWSVAKAAWFTTEDDAYAALERCEVAAGLVVRVL